MAKSKSSKAGNENALASIAGIVAGSIADFMYISFKVPGYNQQSAIQDLTLGDIFQMIGGFAMTSYGFSQGNSRLAPFGFGILAAQVVTKVIFPSLGFARYIIFDIDEQGRLVPQNVDFGGRLKR